MRARYRRRISAPFLDRFDLVVPVTRPTASELLTRTPAESSADVAARVMIARRRADARGAKEPVLTAGATDILSQKLGEGALSARGLGKVTRVAQTIADLAEAEIVNDNHVSEALSLRAGQSVVVA
jgi:magnesium chelatase family protein